MNNFISVVAVSLLLMNIPVVTAGTDSATRELIEQLRLVEAAQPVRETPGWKRPEQIVVMIPSWRKSMKDELLNAFAKVSDGIEIVTVSGRDFTEEERAILAQAQVILGICSPELIKLAEKLHWLQHFGTGVDRCLLSPAAQQADFILTNAQHTAGPTHSGTCYRDAHDADPKPAVFPSFATGTNLGEATRYTFPDD